MTTQHTKGPWEISATGTEWDICMAGGGDMLADLSGCPNAEANARLIAAAPELLEALQGYVAHIESCRAAWEEDGAERNTKMHGLAVALNNIFGDRIEEAIAKATGEPVMAAKHTQ